MTEESVLEGQSVSRIKVLPDRVINMIAAGEVVERPSCVLKELLENSIDAGAKSIKILVKRGGRNLIEVIDDGSGMSCEELKMAFLPHATSKMSGYDLDKIESLGFRGEALAAIAAVSRIEVCSKVPDSRFGWRLSLVGGEQSDLLPDKISLGTRISVSDLFFATPNRLRFLSSERTETQSMLNIVNRIAIAYPEIGFSVSVNTKEVLSYIPHKGTDACLSRIKDIKSMGLSFLDNLYQFSGDFGDLKLRGYAGPPTFNRMNSELLMIYVNGRSVRNNIVFSAIKMAYADFIPKNCYPVVVIFINLPPNQVDVNIHPNKLEVKFEDDDFVRKSIFKVLKDLTFACGNIVAEERNIALMKKFQSDGGGLDVPHIQESLPVEDGALPIAVSLPSDSCIAERMPFIADSNKVSYVHCSYGSLSPASSDLVRPFTGGKFESAKLAIDVREMRLREDEIDNASTSSDLSNAHVLQEQRTDIVPIKQSQSNRDIEDYYLNDILSRACPATTTLRQVLSVGSGQNTEVLDLGNPRFQLKKMYIVSESEGGLFIIDQHAAHERVVYEALKSKAIIEKQSLIFPEHFTVTQDVFEKIEENLSKLERFGVSIICNHDDCGILVKAIPAILGQADVRSLFFSIVESIKEYGRALFLAQNINVILATIACHTSIRAGKILKMCEMEMLLRQMESSGAAAQCNHGRPAYLKIRWQDLATLFERT